MADEEVWTDTPGPQAPGPQEETWQDARPPATARNTAIDVGKQALSSVAAGLENIPASAAKLWALPGQAAEYLAGPPSPGQPWYQRLFAGDPEAVAQREQLGKAMQQRRGMETYLPEPQTELGKTVRNVGEVATSSLGAGPVRGALYAGLGSEALGRLAQGTAAEPYARAAGAVVGGARGAYVGERAGAEAARRQLLDVEAPFGTKQLYQNFDRVAVGQPVNWQVMFATKEQMRGALRQIPYDTEAAEKLVKKLAPQDVSDLAAWRSGMRETLFKKGESSSANALTAIVDRAIEQSLPAGSSGVSLLQSADRQFAITRLAQALDKRITTAEAGTAATHSGANLDNKIRQALQAFKGDTRAWHSLVPQDQIRIQNIINGGVGVNTLRAVANLFGGGGGMGAVVASLLGHTLLPGYGAALPFVGGALKHFENRATENAARDLLASVAGRSAFAVDALNPNRLRISPFPVRAGRAAIYGTLAATPEGYPYYQQ